MFENKDLEGLKREFERKLGIYDYRLTDYDLKVIFKAIENYPISSRTIPIWQSIVRQHTPVRTFLETKALDLSDINYIHQQIQGVLNRQ
jgi:hypothetical protein